MKILGVLVLLIPGLAAAQPSAEPRVAPNLYGSGNLRVSMVCANYAATPQNGLAVAVDGLPIRAMRENGVIGTSYDEDGNPFSTWNQTDTGYLAVPGEHRITVTAPGCAPTTSDVILAADHSEVITGRLAVSDPALTGTAGAPNGPALTLGMMWEPTANGPGGNDLFKTSYAYDPQTSATGAWLSLSAITGSWEVAMDLSFDVGSISGTVAEGQTSTTFAGNAYRFTHDVRIGKRISFRDASLSAGLGLGYEVWFNDTAVADSTSAVFAPDEPDGSWFVPVWAAATIKPACNWGIQGLAEYNVHPTATDSDAVMFGVGVIYQPNDSCSANPWVHVAPDV